MDALRRFPLVVAWLLVVSLMPIGLAVSALAGQPSSAPSGPLQGTSTSPPAQGQHGALVLLRVQALVPDKVKLSDPTQGTVRATVLAIDKEHHQIRL